MNTTLLVDIKGYWEQLDIFEDIPITLVIQQNDLSNLNGRSVPYSKTIDIPGTSNNDTIFENYYEVNGVDFNPLNKIPCVVQYRGTDLFTGLLRMNAVKQQPSGARTYEVYILGEVADFAQQIKELSLDQINWKDITHEVNYSAITTSWEAKNNDVDGLFGGEVLYPLINYGLEYQSDSGTTALFEYSFGEPNSFDQSGFSVPTKFFKPSLRVKNILDRIFALSDYTINSEFFDTDYFKSIYMDCSNNGQIGINTASAQSQSNIFKVYTRPTTIITFGTPGQRPFVWDTFRDSGYDPLNNFVIASPQTTISTDPPTSPYGSNNYFQVPYAGTYSWNWRFNLDDNRVGIGNIRYKLLARKGTNLATLDTETPFYTTGTFNLPTQGAVQSFNIFFTGACLTGEYVRTYIELESGDAGQQLRILPYSESGLRTPAPTWKLYSAPLLTNQDILDFTLNVPNINCFDFLKSMITMFNLILIQDEVSKEIKIEPYSWYYNDTDRTIRDWTQKLDKNSEYRIEPLSFDLAKISDWTYKNTIWEFLNKKWTDVWDYVFGRFRHVSPNTILTGTNTYEMPFGAVPTNGVPNAPNFIIPEFYYLNNGRKTPYSITPHLFFWVGNRYAYKDAFKLEQGSWYLTSGATPVEQTTYPAVSHLSFLDGNIPELISDLNFGSNFDFFGNTNNQIAQFTPYNTYNVFWQSFVANIFSPQTKRLSGRFFFKPIEFHDIKLKDKIFIKDAYYSIERINDADLVNRKLTEVSLIKQNFPYYKITPPAPYYLIDPNQPYPGFLPAFQTPCYVSLIQSEVCNGTTPSITIVTSFGNGTITTGSQLWIDDGTSVSPLPIGNYVRQQNIVGAGTYLVIDNQGRIIQVNC